MNRTAAMMRKFIVMVMNLHRHAGSVFAYV
jgi:hypothetical protein